MVRLSPKTDYAPTQRLLYWLSLFFCLIIGDQAIKYTAVRHGTAFINHGSIFSPPLPLLFVVSLGTVALLIALQSIKTTSSPVRAHSLLLIVTGGVSNLGDRLLRGGVVDVMHIGRLYFNLADLVLLVGIVIVVQPLFVRRDSYSGSTSPFQGDGTGSTPVSRS